MNPDPPQHHALRRAPRPTPAEARDATLVVCSCGKARPRRAAEWWFCGELPVLFCSFACALDAHLGRGTRKLKGPTTCPIIRKAAL